MMLNQNFELKRSPYYAITSALFMLVTLVIIGSLPLNGYVRLSLGMVASVILCIYIVRYSFLRGQNTIISLRFSKEGGWEVYRSDSSFPADLLDNSYASRYLMVLGFRNCITKRKHQVVILSDSLAKNDYRELRALLFSHCTKP
jgi:hypothetical protein